MKIFEINAIRKDLRNKIKFALCMPSIYRVGMSSLAMHVIYNILNSFEDVACERVFLPTGSHPPHSLESNQPLGKFDFVAFSLHYELNHTNVLKILLNSGIPAHSSERDLNQPLIIAGGPICSNPVPLSSFIDLFVIGDFEPIVHDFLSIYRSSKDKEAFLEQVAGLEGIYVPKYTDGIVRKVCEKSLDDYPYAIRQIVPQVNPKSPFFPSLGKSFLLEISRGCNRGCRFCLIGFQERPIRFRTFNKIQQIISNGIEITKLNKVSLIGSGLSDHPKIEDICWQIINEGLELSLPSVRLDCISDDLLEALVKGGQKTLTLAPEVGSDRLLGVIHKGFSANDILSAIKNVKNGGIENLKLYFLINLPTETSMDVEAIGNLVQRINEMGYKGSYLKLSVNCFIPKPHTPFQWESSFNLEDLRKKMKKLKNLLKRDVSFLDPRWAKIQTYLSLGNASIGESIHLSARLGGGLGAWNRALRNTRYEHLTYEMDSELPWDMIEFEFNKNKLKKEFLIATQD